MRILCAVGWHKPSQKIIENEGRTYSRCKRCGADLIKVGEGWKTAPRGYRVIWKDPNAPETAETAKEPAKRKPRSGAKSKARKPSRRKSEVVNVAAAARAVEAAETAEAQKPAAQKKGAAKDSAVPESTASEGALPKRRRVERRTSKEKVLPAKLGGKERRRTRNRREGFGKKPDVEA